MTLQLLNATMKHTDGSTPMIFQGQGKMLIQKSADFEAPAQAQSKKTKPARKTSLLTQSARFQIEPPALQCLEECLDLPAKAILRKYILRRFIDIMTANDYQEVVAKEAFSSDEDIQPPQFHRARLATAAHLSKELPRSQATTVPVRQILSRFDTNPKGEPSLLQPGDPGFSDKFSICC